MLMNQASPQFTSEKEKYSVRKENIKLVHFPLQKEKSALLLCVAQAHQKCLFLQ